MKKIAVADLIASPVVCECGKRHTVGIKKIILQKNALAATPRLLAESGFKKPFMVSDVHTFAAAGEKLLALLAGAAVPCASYSYTDENLVGDEAALGKLFIALDPDCDVILAVGSGTINDICRFTAAKIGKPFISVPTAPSMDGIASAVAPLISGGLKVTFEAAEPAAVVADLAVLAAAPAHMIAAGVGDILGKYTCLCDWRLSRLINGEYYCDYLAELVNASVEQVVAAADGLASRDEGAIASLTEALILSGIVISFAGNSRPASGCEHHLSHFWEMQALFAGKIPALHGAKVGYATIVMLDAAKKLRALLSADLLRQAMETKPADGQKRAAEIRRVYGIAAAEVAELGRKTATDAEENRLKRLSALAANLEDVISLLDRLPESAFVRDLLAKTGGAVTPAPIGVSEAQVRDAVLYAKELRNRFTLLQLLHDLRLADRILR